MARLLKAFVSVFLLAISGYSGAAITFVGSDVDSGNDSDATLSIPSSVQTGDLLLVQLSYLDRSGSDGNTPPSGWTSIGSLQNEDDLYQQLYYRVAQAGEAGTNTFWDFDGGGNRRMVSALLVFRGVDTSNPIDTSSAWANRMFFNSVTAPSVTTSADNAMLVAFYSVEAGNDSFSQGVGLTEVYDRETGNSGNGLTASAAYVLQATAGASGDKNATVNNATVDDAIGQLVALNEGTSSYPLIQSVSGACGTDNIIVVEFDGAIDNSALDTSLFSLNGAAVTAVTRQSDDTLVLSVTGFVGGQFYLLTFDGADYTVSFQGLLGRYFDQRDSGGTKQSYPGGLFSGNELLRLDSQLDFSWDSATPGIFPSVSGNDERFSIRWTGYVEPSTSGSYEFRLYSDDGMRMDLEGVQLIDDWSLHSPRYSSASAAQALTAGSAYQIQVEHFENTGRAYAQLEWRRDGGSWENVPTGNLNTCPSLPAVLTPVIDYHFDESAWTGALGEVLDSSGNASNGDTQGGLDTTSEAHLCRAAEFDGVDDYIEEASIYSTLSDTASMSFWIKTTQTGNDTGWRAPGVAGVEESGGADDIFWGWLDASGRIGISVGNEYSTKSTVAINDDNFHHIVLTRDASTGDWQIYIDNVLNNSGTSLSGVIGNTFSSIGRIEDTGGSPEYFEGILDELKIFDYVLTATEIDQIYNETRNCNTLAPVAHYAFEQSPWSGSGVTIEDYTGNGNDGLSLGNVADNADGYVCRGVDIPNNTSSNQIDAVSSQLDINTALGNEGTIMLWYRSETDWVGSGNRTLIDATSRVFNNANDKYFFLSKQNDGRLRFALEDSSDRDFNLYTSSQAFVAQTWVHLAITWDFPNDDIAIYVNGSEAAANNSINSNGVLGDLGVINFGDNTTGYISPGSSAYGRLDEIRLYSEVLAESQIASAAAETHGCTATCSLGSFAISQPAYGLACPQSRATVTVQAMCQDGTTPKTDYSGTINFSSTDFVGSSFYDAQSGGSQIASLLLDGSESGAATVYLFHDNEDSDLRVIAEDTVEFVSSTASSGTDFRTSGFVASAPANFACGNSSSFTLTAIGQDTAASGTCNVLTGFDGAKSLKVWSDINVDATESPGVKDTGLPRSMSFNGSSISETQPGTNNASATFNLGVASVNLQYMDVGEILGINIRHDDSPYDGSATLEDGTTISPLLVTTSPFVVAPAAVEVVADAATSVCNGATEAALGACSAFVGAGQDFSITTSAHCADASSTLAASYQGTVSLSHQLVAPSSGTLGALGLTQVVLDGSETTGGQRQSSNQNISEVGVFTLTSSPAPYFGQSVSATVSENIGRLYPDNFSVSVLSGSFADACGNFTYIGQPFSYDVLPSATIVARNASNGTTENYTNTNFLKLGAADINRSFPSADVSNLGSDGVTLLNVSSTPNLGSLSVLAPGELNFSFDAGDSYRYDKDVNSVVVPFDSDLTIQLTSLQDSDGVSAATLPSWNPLGAEHRYGRWRMENVFGPEDLALSMLAQAEYLDASSNFVVNTDDSCSAIDVGMSVTDSNGSSVSSPYTNIDVGDGSSNLSYNTTLVSGRAGFVFSAPGLASAGNSHRGSIGVSVDLSTMPWLRVDWDGDGDMDADDDPERSATFGQYRGNDRIIYWREVLP